MSQSWNKTNYPVTVNEMIAYGAKLLKSYDKADANIDAELLALYILGYTKLERIMNASKEVEKSDFSQYKEYIEKRCSGIPLQYITHEQEFMGLPFYVDQNVLIPRQDTETLVETLIEKSKLKPFKNIIEIGVGSGCISISLAKFLPYANIVGIDISNKALEIASKNANKNGVADQIKWICSDLFNNYSGEKNIDLIVSNPPYITTEDCSILSEEIKKHEPMLALDGGMDGLDFYRQITIQAKKYLCIGGILAYEIGYNQANDISNILKDNGYKYIEVIKDLANKDRVVIGVLEK